MGTHANRLDALDGIRAVAVIAVLFAHTGWYIAHGGYLGVDMFFVLSGFLITRLLVVEHERTGRIALGRFYARRALRLYPALVVAVVIAGAAGDRLFPSPGEFWRATAVTLTYLMDIARALGFQGSIDGGSLGITWSLAVEEHFYLLWPLILIAVLRRNPQRRTVLIASVSLAAVSWLSLVAASAAGVSGVSLYFQPELRCAALFVGCAIACLPSHTRLPAPGAVAAVTGAGLLVLLQVGGPNTTLGAYAFRMPATWILTALLIVALIGASRSPVAGLLGWAPIAYVGRISYGIYLYHFPILELLAQQNLRFAVRMPLNVLLPVAAASVSFHLIEQPFLRLKDKLAREPGVSAPDVAVATP